ncbi:MAG: ABC transporter ATP-binding protein [Propionibacteriales bacterium]|nr:ABC transporter ATP-binding protein [Propionibacteriales bacterium]
MDSTALYEATGLTRLYGHGPDQVRAVDGIDLSIARGERLGLVGESGSGKSTLIRMLAALDRPTSGTITFDGTPVTGRPERRLGFLRSAVQIVFQDPRSSLNPRMTAGDIITEPLRSPLLRRREDVPTDRGRRLAEVIDQVGLPADTPRRHPHEFSGGQRQRIALARALAPRPQVLIADEPVSALDVSLRSQVINLINDLVAQDGLTLVLVTHDLAVVRHLCSTVAVMRSGQVVERGPMARVTQEPRHPYTQELLSSVLSLDP